MAVNAAAIASAVEIPLIADADTGYGGRRAVAKTVRTYERAGVAALHLEDQKFPKRCGHLDGKTLVETEEMVGRLAAAVNARSDDDFMIIARTDALGVSGIDDAFRRCEAYVRAGADALFVEAIPSAFVAERLARSFDVPLLYNFVESGKSPLLRASELERLGFPDGDLPGVGAAGRAQDRGGADARSPPRRDDRGLAHAHEDPP